VRAYRIVLALAGSALTVFGATAIPASADIDKVHVQPIVNFKLPPTSAGCTGDTLLPGGVQRLPITVSTVAGQVSEMINVCIGNKGPFPFIIDTGAGESVIDAHLAQRLHLKADGPESGIEGVGCTASSHPVRVASWSAAGATLAPQILTAATLPDFGIKGEPVGLLGSDVFSRFGAIRIDFAAHTLTLGTNTEGPAPSDGQEVTGPTGPPPPAALTQGKAGTTVPVTAVLEPGSDAIQVAMTLGHGRSHIFVVDTGSSQSVVSTALAKQHHLSHTNQAQRQTTVCSTVTVPMDKSGPWSIPGVTLHQQLVDVIAFGPISSNGTAGLLGSDQLKRFGWVVLDYSGGRMILG
jgi:predicted aspartyl protease